MYAETLINRKKDMLGMCTMYMTFKPPAALQSPGTHARDNKSTQDLTIRVNSHQIMFTELKAFNMLLSLRKTSILTSQKFSSGPDSACSTRRLV